MKFLTIQETIKIMQNNIDISSENIKNLTVVNAPAIDLINFVVR